VAIAALLQTVVVDDVLDIDADLVAKDYRRLPTPEQRAASNDDGRPIVDFVGQTSCHATCLGDAVQGQHRVQMSLVATDAVPRGLAMADEEYFRMAHDF